MPQHLQLLDGYYEQLLDRRLAQLSPHLWGLGELEIDADQLARGVFCVSRLTAVLPDGLLVEVGPHRDLTQLSLTVGEQQRGRTIEVHLGVPASPGPLATQQDPARAARFLKTSEVVADLYREADDAEVECIRPHAQLLLGHESRQGYISFKLAELVHDAAGRLALSDRYIPTCLSARVAPVLMERLSRLVGWLGSKQRELAGRYGGRMASMVEFGAADVATFWYLHTVNGSLPRLMHYADGTVHPELLYLTLAALAGQLSSFETSSDPLTLPRYQHADLSATMLPLFERLFELLGAAVASRYVSIPLEQSQPGLFVGRIDDPQLLRRNTLYLLAGGDVPEEILRDDLPRYVKIGAIDQIAHIVQAALPGVGVRIDLAPPSGIPVRAHMVYLRLEKQGRYWDGVVQSGSVAIYQPVKPEQIKLELVAVEA